MTKLRTYSFDSAINQNIYSDWNNTNIFCRFTDCVHLHNQ